MEILIDVDYLEEGEKASELYSFVIDYPEE